jgi:recombination protein RecT
MATNGTEIAVLTPKEAGVLAVGTSVTPLARYLKTKMATIKAVVPKHFDADAHYRTALMMVARKPELRDCTIESICQAVIDAGALGLYLNTHLGQAWIVPFGRRDSRLKDAVMIPGYAGLIQLGFNTGLLESIRVVSVFKGDDFVYQEGLEQKCEHTPRGNQNPREITHVYTVTKMRGNPPFAKVFLRERIEQIRATSPQKDGTTWRNNYQAMAEKSAIRQTFKTLPKSPERLARAMSLYDEHEGLVEQMDVDFDVIETSFVDAEVHAESEPSGDAAEEHGRPEDAEDMAAALNVPPSGKPVTVGHGH